MQDDGQWKEVTKKQALEKASQAMREKKWNLGRQPAFTTFREARTPTASEALGRTAPQPSSGSSSQSMRTADPPTPLGDTFPAANVESPAQVAVETPLQSLQPVESAPADISFPAQQHLPAESTSGDPPVPEAEVPDGQPQVVGSPPGDTATPGAEHPDEYGRVPSAAAANAEPSE
jgi:hypothetical protein